MSSDDPVVNAIAHVTGLPHSQISYDAALYPDLNVSGGDGFEIVEELSKYYEIDWTGFDGAEWFGVETMFSPITFVYELITGAHRTNLERVRTLTVDHIRQVCIRGKWFEPDDSRSV